MIFKELLETKLLHFHPLYILLHNYTTKHVHVFPQRYKGIATIHVYTRAPVRQITQKVSSFRINRNVVKITNCKYDSPR